MKSAVQVYAYIPDHAAADTAIEFPDARLEVMIGAGGRLGNIVHLYFDDPNTVTAIATRMLSGADELRRLHGEAQPDQPGGTDTPAE